MSPWRLSAAGAAVAACLLVALFVWRPAGTTPESTAQPTAEARGIEQGVAADSLAATDKPALGVTLKAGEKEKLDSLGYIASEADGAKRRDVNAPATTAPSAGHGFTEGQAKVAAADEKKPVDFFDVAKGASAKDMGKMAGSAGGKDDSKFAFGVLREKAAAQPAAGVTAGANGLALSVPPGKTTDSVRLERGSATEEMELRARVATTVAEPAESKSEVVRGEKQVNGVAPVMALPAYAKADLASMMGRTFYFEGKIEPVAMELVKEMPGKDALPAQFSTLEEVKTAAAKRGIKVVELTTDKAVFDLSLDRSRAQTILTILAKSKVLTEVVAPEVTTAIGGAKAGAAGTTVRPVAPEARKMAGIESTEKAQAVETLRLVFERKPKEETKPAQP